MAFSRRIAALIVLPLVASVLAATCGLLPNKEPVRPNVLWITIDSLRADHLGCTGYGQARTPNIDALAAEGVLFTQCISQATFTHISVPSMLTGKYPYFTGVRTIVPDLDSSQVTLAEILSPQGYFACAIPEPWMLGFFQGFERWQQISQDTRQKTRWCLQTLDDLGRRPSFIWLYYWDPHAPYEPPETFMNIYEPDYTTDSKNRLSVPARMADNVDLKDATGHYSGMVETLVRLNKEKISPSPADLSHLMHLYDAEIALVDSSLGGVLEKVKAMGLWDSTLVVLSADHGEGFGEHGQFYHGTNLYEEEIRVPLIIKPPSWAGSGKTISAAVRNMDIMPTILDYCRLKPPRDIQGESLRPAIDGNAAIDRPACIETHNLQNQTHLIGYRAGGYKLICNLTAGSTELYQLALDPGERIDLIAGPDNREEEDRLRTALLETLGAEDLSDLKVSQTAASMDPHEKERLRALGYIY